jgi:AcrR family transcriptional regulator
MAGEQEGSGKTPRGYIRRESILAAATEVFAALGYPSASINDVAAKAGIAKSVIYDHFASKAEIYTAIVEAEARELAERRATAIPAPGSVPTEVRLRVAIDTFFRFVEDRPAGWRLLMRDPPPEPELFAVRARLDREDAEAVASVLTRMRPTGPVRRMRKEAVGEFLRSSIRSLANWWQDHPGMPREQVVDMTLEFLWHGLQRVVATERAGAGEPPAQRPVRARVRRER